MATNDVEERQVMVSAWVDRTMAEELEEAARTADRSKSAEVRVALRAHLARAHDEMEGRER